MCEIEVGIGLLTCLLSCPTICAFYTKYLMNKKRPPNRTNISHHGEMLGQTLCWPNIWCECVSGYAALDCTKVCMPSFFVDYIKMLILLTFPRLNLYFSDKILFNSYLIVAFYYYNVFIRPLVSFVILPVCTSETNPDKTMKSDSFIKVYENAYNLLE